MRGGAATLALVSALAAGCIEAADTGSLPVMCELDSDCDSAAGEVCDEGVCWGDPPDTVAFAAVLMPPAERPDLAPTELAFADPSSELSSFSIADDGTITGLAFAPTVTISGRVVLACTEELEGACGAEHPVQAQVTAERAGGFAGGPAYSRSVLAQTDVTRAEPSFTLRLPADGRQYRVTIIPDDGDLTLQSGGNPAAQAPPMSLLVTADHDQQVVWELGNPADLKTISGCVQNSVGDGQPYAGMHVSALGRWSPGAPLERASAVVISDASGCFELEVPIAMEDEFDVVAKPAPTSVLPTIRLANQKVPDPDPEAPEAAFQLAPLVMPNTPNPTTFKLPVRGVGSGGEIVPVPGADLRFETRFEPPPTETREVTVTYTAQATSGGLGSSEPGIALVDLYPGGTTLNRTYTVRVVPPPESEFSSRFDLEVSVGTGEGAPVLAAIELSRRVAVTGTFTTAAGEPLADTPVEVRVSRAVLAPLTDRAQAQVVERLQFPTDTTGASGEFFVWLDRSLVGVDAIYDFDLSPPASAGAPHWTFAGLTLDRAGSVELPTMSLPPASFARGLVVDASGDPVPGAEVRLYQLPAAELCPLDSEDDCTASAPLRGIWEADGDGRVRLVLPDP